MERKITLLALLIVTFSITSISVAQADPEGGLIAMFPAPHLYSDVASSDLLTVIYTNPLSLPGGFFDAVEPVYQGGGLAPIPDGIILVHTSPLAVPANFPIGSIQFVKGYEEARFTFDNLTPFAAYAVTVKISDMDFFDTYAAPGAVGPIAETVFISGNGVPLGSVVASTTLGFGAGQGQTIMTTLGTTGTADGAGLLVVGFNENFVWDDTVSPSPWDAGIGICTTIKVAIPGVGIGTECRGEEPGIRVEEISLVLSAAIGGSDVPINTSALLLAGVQSISMWMIPVLVAGIGIGVFLIKRRN